MRRLTTFPSCMLMFGFAVVVSFGQPATAQEETADDPQTEQVAENEIAAANPEEEAETDEPAEAERANTDDAAPSPSDVGNGNVPPPAPETQPEEAAPHAEAGTPPAPAEGTPMDDEAAEAAVVEPNDCCGVIVDEAIHDAAPAPVCCQAAPVCCQPAPTWYYPPQRTYHSPGGFLHHFMCR